MTPELTGPKGQENVGSEFTGPKGQENVRHIPCRRAHVWIAVWAAGGL
jgi:hypothetical protein